VTSVYKTWVRMARMTAAVAITATWTTALSSQPAVTSATPANLLVSITPATLPRIGKVDERYQSYNVESVEVTGGNFWAPYPKPGEAPRQAVAGPHGTGFATGAYQRREPLNLQGNRRLRVMTKALGPAYMRVSGSWANNIWFQDDDQPMRDPPKGYQGVLTRKQWAGVVEFGKHVDAKILTSFATNEAARRPDGTWDPEGARRLFAYTRSLGGKIDAVELSNEPNMRQPVYDAQFFARDIATLRDLIRRVSPETLLVGPASTGEAGFKLFDVPPEIATTARLLSGTPTPRFDVFSHHFYGAVSQRCKSLGERPGNIRNVNTSAAEALSEAWLSRADQGQSYYRQMRDRFAPGAPIWITETAQTACGGDPWASTFLDTFRYVDQLGRWAKQDVSIVFHNTLAASDYALIDDRTWLPRPNYWAALLWRRLMGTTVLDTGPNPGDLHLYAHCLRGRPGGVTLVAINLSRTATAQLNLPVAAKRYTLTSDVLESDTVKLNGRALALTAGDQIPALPGARVRRGTQPLPPVSITFFEIPQAGNRSCR
jgi:heparanase 1